MWVIKGDTRSLDNGSCEYTLSISKSILCLTSSFYWVAVKELSLSYYIGETLLFTINTHYGNLI